MLNKNSNILRVTACLAMLLTSTTCSTISSPISLSPISNYDQATSLGVSDSATAPYVTSNLNKYIIGDLWLGAIDAL